MEKYRIVTRTRSSDTVPNKSFIVQYMRFSFFGKGVWEDVDKKVGLNTDSISFPSYEEAEVFILKNLIRGDGEIEVSGNVYSFRRYTGYYY